MYLREKTKPQIRVQTYTDDSDAPGISAARPGLVHMCGHSNSENNAIRSTGPEQSRTGSGGAHGARDPTPTAECNYGTEEPIRAIEPLGVFFRCVLCVQALSLSLSPRPLFGSRETASLSARPARVRWRYRVRSQSVLSFVHASQAAVTEVAAASDAALSSTLPPPPPSDLPPSLKRRRL